jgi:hypothetical protein
MSFETTWRLVAAALGAALVLAGCTPMQWVKDDATPEERQQDVMACQQAAWQEARSRGWYYRPFGGLPYASGRRFFSGPFGPYGDPFGDPFMEEARLTRFCMQSKGYELVPREPGD